MKRVTPSELLDLREPPWGRKLRGVSLVAEVEIPGDYCRQAAQALGMLYRKWVNAHRDPAPLFDSWPACTAVAMAWVAAEHYEQGTYWPFLWREVGYPATTDDHPAWGLGFQRAVGSLGMPTFPEMPMPYLGPVLMHSGIPTYCLEDFFRLLLQRQRAEPGLDAESFMSWATAPGRELRLHELDMPARRFLQYGGDFALDVVERCIDLLHRLLDPDPDLDGVGLPARIVARARELAAQERLELIPATSARNGLRREQPRITLDPFGRGVEVRLPAVSEAPDGVATWKIAADHVQTVVRSQALWVGAAEGTPPTTYALPGPVRSVMVSLADSALESELTVVDPADPLLVFTEDGRRVPANLPLPTEPIWVLHPENQELTVDGPLDVRAEGALPLGWNGWQLRLLSLEGVRALGLTRRRPVRGFTRPRILVGEPLPGVTTPYGSPVFAEPPTLWLPGESAALTAWFVEVRPSSGGDAVVTRRFDTTEPTTVEDLWKELPRPLLGAYDIVVRGPLGRGARRSVVIAEGLHVAYRPYVRLFTGAGLTAGQAELTSGSPASSRQLEFTPRMRALSVTHDVPGASEPLVITPPHLQVLREVPGEAATWSMGPLRLSTESFTEPGALLVRLPGATALPPIQVSTGNGIMQVLEPSGRQHDGTARYELARISDTIAEQKVADLLLGETPLAFVRPRRLATGVRDLGDRLGLEDATPVEGLVAGIYLVTAPWREPWVLPVEDGLIGLPPELLDSGPMRVLLQIEDPWTFTEWPRWPVGAGGFLCDRPGFYQAGDVEETALASFLIGDAPFPTDVAHPARL
ncbi:MAG: hypothetical protein JWL97_3424, partial [Gemmatimonadales bacterium]|nr:hypothetical protein [Gemmatimonadales bacterium]